MAKQGCQEDEFVPVWKLICLDFSNSIVSVHFASAIDRLFEVEFDTSLAAWTLPLHKIVCGLPPPKLGDASARRVYPIATLTMKQNTMRPNGLGFPDCIYKRLQG